jgi:hypothetical protein
MFTPKLPLKRPGHRDTPPAMTQLRRSQLCINVPINGSRNRSTVKAIVQSNCLLQMIGLSGGNAGAIRIHKENFVNVASTYGEACPLFPLSVLLASVSI